MTDLDPDLARLLPELEALLGSANGAAPTMAELRDSVSELLAYLRLGPVASFHGEVRDERLVTEVGPVPVRVYEPAAGNHDVVFFFHGGGWMVGSCDSADGTARALAEQLKVTVVSVDYRLAPENPFPAALDDCLAVVKVVAADRPSAWLGVAGDSAGGNLAAAVSLAAARVGLLIGAQLLIYPVLDCRRDTQSYKMFATGYLLTADAMAYYWDSYAATQDRSNPLLSPTDAPDLTQFPPTVVTSAGFDPLRDEAEDVAARLVACGVSTVYLPAPSLTHGWLEMGARVPAARLAREEAFAALNLLRIRARRSLPQRSPS